MSSISTTTTPAASSPKSSNPVQILKIYGERNTSTNYLAKLVRLNLDVSLLPETMPRWLAKINKRLPAKEPFRDFCHWWTYSNDLGWKHARVKSVDELRKYPIVREGRVGFLTLTKNPYSWILSLFRNPYHLRSPRQPDVESFLKTPWITVHRDGTARQLANPVELWNIKNASYIPLRELGGMNLKTESLFVDPGQVVATIQQHFGVSRKSEDFVNFEDSTKVAINRNEATKNAGKDSNYYRDYYLQEKWRANLSAEAISLINQSVDRSLMAEFGYRLIDV